ncbi:MAG: thymidylate synthase [Nanoarchaeota archaeon]
MFQALYKATRLIYGNPESNIGIVTLWSKPKELAQKIDSSKYCVLGPLYSAERGLDLLIRNLLANPQINVLLVTGVDFSKSGIVLRDFFEKGFFMGKTDTTEKPCWRVNSDFEGYIDLDIPENVLNLIRESVILVKVPDLSTFDFGTVIGPEKKREKMVFVKKEEQVKKYTGEYIGYVVRGKTVAEAWLKVLDTILKFGKESGTHYDDMQKEIVNLMSVISDEDPYNLNVPEFFPSDQQHVNEYIPRMTKDLPGGITKKEYTYGSRMRSWFGTDQVKGAVEKLVREPVSRAVVISLWDSIQDLTLGGSPCLNHIWFRINNDRLFMTSIFRSHDMFEGYPENALALRVLQEEVRKEVENGLKANGHETELKLGNLVILSQSAHIYDDSWERCQKIVDMYLPRYSGLLSEFDPRGNLIINVEDDEIVVEHTSNTRETLGLYRAKSSEQMRDLLVKENIISLVPHALDIGLELMKAEIAIKMNLHYVQDNRLELKSKEEPKVQEAPKVETPKPILRQSNEEINLLKRSKEQLTNILNNLKTR